MGKYRPPTKKSKYYIPREDYLTAVHYCLRYPLWEEELAKPLDTSKAITYDQDRVQTSGGYNPVETVAIRRADAKAKIRLIEDTAHEATADHPYIYRYLLSAVTKGETIEELKWRGMPICEKGFRRIRQHFYYLLSKKI